MIRIGVGLVLGVAAVLAFNVYAPKNMVADAKRTAEVTTSAVQKHSKQAAFDVCRQRFLDETFCYRKATNAEGKTACDQQISQKCGN